MIFSPITTMNSTSIIPPARVQSPSFHRKRNLPTPPPSFADVNDSSSCSSSSSSSASSAYSTTTTTSSSTAPSDNTQPVGSCDLLNIITDARFRPVFQAIDEIKRRKCRPDLERILKYVAKRATTKNISYQREEILAILDDLLKYGLITKVFHKGGFTIRIKNEKYAKLIEKMNICYNQKTPTATPMSPHEAIAAAAAAGTIPFTNPQWPANKPYETPSTTPHTRETPSPEFAVFKIESSLDQNNNSGQVHPMLKENTLTNGPLFLSPLPPLNKKRTRTQTFPTTNAKKSCLMPVSDAIPIYSPDEHLFRKPLLTHHNLPPITIEQLLGIRGDIPDVHHWTINNLNDFFSQQGYECASILFNQHQINGKKLYELKREDVFRMSVLKIGKLLKLWNIIEQIQRKSLS